MKKTILAALILCMSNSLFAQKKVNTEGITNATHQKYLNSIVFTTDFDPSLSKDRPIEANFKNSFDYSPGATIYFRAYFDNSIYNYLNPLLKNKAAADLNTYGMGLNFYIDGKLADKLTNTTDLEFKDEQIKTWTTYRGALMKDNISGYFGDPQFRGLLSTYADILEKGKHTIKVEIYPVAVNKSSKETIKGDVIASGTFTFNADNIVFDPYNEKYCFEKNVLTDTKLLQEIQSVHTGSATIIVNPKDVRVISKDWVIERNEYGIVVRRVMYNMVGYKNLSDGNCYRQKTLVFQNFDGVGYSKVTQKGVLHNEPEFIDCRCLSK